MCGSMGMTELIVVLLIVVMVFGVGKLPQIGDALGRSIKNFKKAVNTQDEIDVTPKKEIGEGSQSASASPIEKVDVKRS